MKVIDGCFRSTWVAVALRKPSAYVFFSDACAHNAALDLDKLRPEHRAVADGLLKVPDAFNPGVDVDALAVVPVPEFGYELVEIGLHLLEPGAENRECYPVCEPQSTRGCSSDTSTTRKRVRLRCSPPSAQVDLRPPAYALAGASCL